MVNIEKEEDEPSDLYFKNGWPRFVKENGLEVADFLFFEYDGKSRFQVIIFGKSACEKKLERKMSRARMNNRNNSHKKHDVKPTATTTHACPENLKGKAPMNNVEIKEERVNLDEPGTSYHPMRDEMRGFLCHEGEETEEDEEEDDDEEDEDYDGGEVNKEKEVEEEEEEEEEEDEESDVGKLDTIFYY